MSRHHFPRFVRFTRTRIFLAGLVFCISPLIGLLNVASPGAFSASAAGYEETPWLGISVQEITPDLSDALGLRMPEGVLVTAVAQDSPAEWAGLRKEDVILEFDGLPVQDPTQLVALIRGHRPGEELRLKIWRYGDEHLMRVRLGSRAAESVAPDADVTTPTRPEVPLLPKEPAPSLPPENLGDYFASLRQPTLGVQVVPLNESLARHFNARPDEGLLIVEVVPSSAAEQAGLEPGDIILRVDGNTVSTVYELRAALREAEQNEVEITILRDGNEQDVSAEITAPRRETEEPSESERLLHRYGRGYGEELAPQEPGYSQEMGPALRDYLRNFQENLNQAPETARSELARMREEINRLQRELDKLRQELRETLRDLREQN